MKKHLYAALIAALLDLLVPRIAKLPVLLLITYRPEYRPDWTGAPHVTALTLNRLNRRLGACVFR